MTQKATSKKISDFDAMVVFVMKIIDRDAEVSTEKTMVALVFEIDGGGIHRKMVFIN